MAPATYFTTSWDDGNPLDFRIAEMLSRHKLGGTFYIPRSAATRTMTPAQVRELADSFEIGAHTLGHIFLTDTDDATANSEIADSRSWVEQTTGKPCRMFCPPAGRFTRTHLLQIEQAGYTGVRTVEFLSLSAPRRRGGLMMMPTTVQAHPHRAGRYARNLAKRGVWRNLPNLWLYIVHGHPGDWLDLSQRLMARVLRNGGVFHLWGHSWELQETAQWTRLEEVLRLMGELTEQAPCLANSEVCEAFHAGSGSRRRLPAVTS